MADMSVSFCGIEFKNPIVAASGTFGFGREYSEYYDLSKLGGICVKGLTPLPREGNRPPRIAETPGGMLNSVGLQNPGVDEFIRTEMPFLRSQNTVVIANISGNTVEEFAEMSGKLSDAGVSMIEVNVSCPNVHDCGILFGTSTDAVAAVTRAVKARSKVPVMIKLSPNVTDIAEMAKAAEGAGADAVSLINTITGMRIDVNTRRPILANNTGGLSGSAVFPVAVRMVWQTANAVKIPVLGMGGVSSGRDAAELMLAGASLVAVGTAILSDPYAPVRIIGELEEYVSGAGIAARDLTGKVILN